MRFLPYAQLLRLPNVFTAFADILLGTLATGMLLTRPLASGLLMLASGSLYCGGMVWNDYFDLAEDKRDRPFRPLPSGRIAPGMAACLGAILLVAGLSFALAASLLDRPHGVWNSGPFAVAAALVVAILLYDAWLKRTRFGPIGMGACRFLNILLAVYLIDTASFPWYLRLHLAAVVGIYIIGVTWFARAEAGRSNVNQLRGAALVILSAIVLAVALPVHRPPGSVTAFFPYLLLAYGFFLGVPILRATGKPEAILVQAAVKRCILGLVVLDAVLATAFVGLYGLLLVLLLAPALLLGRRIYST